MIEEAFLNDRELRALALGAVGEDVRISRQARLHGAGRIHIGDHVRIDDFVVITTGEAGEVHIGDHVHIAAHAALFGGGGIVVQDFATVSGRASIYSTSDDYGGAVMTNPTVPEEYTGVVRERVLVGRHVVIGSGTVLLPGVTIGEGAAVGALSLVTEDLQSWTIYAGVPVRRLRPRSRELLALEKALLAREDDTRRQGPG